MTNWRKRLKDSICLSLCTLFLLCSTCISEDSFPSPVLAFGELRGGRYFSVTLETEKAIYEGIFDILEGEWVVPLSSDNSIMGYFEYEEETDNNNAEKLQKKYIGGKDTGIYWISANDRTAFLDVPSGYLSDFLFSDGTDPDFWHNDTAFLRVANEEYLYGYVDRNNGKMLTDFIFDQMNFIGFCHGYALDKLDKEEKYVIIDSTGFMIELPNVKDVNLNSFEFIKENETQIEYIISSYYKKDIEHVLYYISINKINRTVQINEYKCYSQ